MGTAQQLALLFCKPLQGAPAGVQLLEEVDMSDLRQGTDSDSSMVCEYYTGRKSCLFSCYRLQKLDRFMPLLDISSSGLIYASAVKKEITFLPKLVFQGEAINPGVAISVCCHRDCVTSSEKWLESTAVVSTSYCFSLGEIYAFLHPGFMKQRSLLESYFL